MKKTTKYATRRTTRLMSAARQKVFDGVKRDIAHLKTTAGLHAWAGSNVSVIVHASCRLIFIALGAATLSNVSADDVDVRILRSSINAASDLRDTPAALESHRASIKAGLIAVDRLLPRCSDYSVAEAAINLEIALKTGVLTA